MRPVDELAKQIAWLEAEVNDGDNEDGFWELLAEQERERFRAIARRARES